MMTVSRIRFALVAAATLLSACTIQQTELPPLMGPSELALSISLTAAPDHLTQDGSSQSTIVVSARGPNGEPLDSVAIRVDIAVDGTLVDYGTLSARNVVTGGDGRATVTYTAPPAPPVSSGPVTVVTIIASPVSTNYQAGIAHGVDIRLTTPGVILPPAGTPTPRIIFSPAAPLMNAPVFFDASTSCAEGSTCASSDGIVSFAWLFGDGSQGSGERPTHTYAAPGTYGVTLTVTNSRGLSASTTETVAITAGSAPTATFVFSPAQPQVNETVFFNGDASRPAPGRTIVQWAWRFGDGSPSITDDNAFNVSHKFGQPGTYVVVLTIQDDLGGTATATQSVTVGANPTPGAAVADFVFSPTAPAPGQTVFFNAATSTTAQNQTITKYEWNFGDDSTGTGKTPAHTYPVAGTYTVTLKVTDSAGRTDVTAKTVPVGVVEDDDEEEEGG